MTRGSVDGAQRHSKLFWVTLLVPILFAPGLWTKGVAYTIRSGASQSVDYASVPTNVFGIVLLAVTLSLLAWILMICVAVMLAEWRALRAAGWRRAVPESQIPLFQRTVPSGAAALVLAGITTQCLSFFLLTGEQSLHVLIGLGSLAMLGALVFAVMSTFSDSRSK